ncbi:MAG: penicillin-binding protein 2 [Betaproteobacteria bacterium]|nr:penicillin-binding protein 2 [Betaproteobacteria bacterium]
MSNGFEIRDSELELHQFRARLWVAAGFVFVMFGLLAARFVYLQVVKYDHYHTLAEANRISIVPVVPNRGIITDRNGVGIAHNYSAYTLEIRPGRVDDLEKLINELAAVVEIAPRDRRRFRRLLEESKNFESLPIRTRLTEEEIARFAANRYRFPAVEINARPFREYPHGELFAHVVGYIGRINERDVKQLEAAEQLSNYRGTDHIGKVGIEQSYERHLHGTTGMAKVEIDAAGRAIRSLSRVAPISGNNLVLTLDARLQEVAYNTFGEFRGALVAIDPRNGEVLAFVSKPGFDPNLFVDGIDAQSWSELINSPDKPMTNRALHGQYPPGSTIKPFMALAALTLGKRTPQYTINDPGFFTLPGVSHQWRDWKKGGHGAVDLHKSIVVSCDTYYYGLANDLGIDNIHNYLSQFGFGARTGIDIEGEAIGILPSQQWKQRRFKQKWFVGDTISVGIGQGYMTATPLQLAHATAIIANGGNVVRPHLVQHVQDSRTLQLQSIARPSAPSLEIRADFLGRVQNALVDVLRPGGTAARSGAGASYPFAGKTGTSQVIAIKPGERYDAAKVHERHRDHALFIAYAPAENPVIALAVLVENGGSGSSTAAPIARQVLDYYLLGRDPQPLRRGKEEPDEHRD